MILGWLWVTFVADVGVGGCVLPARFRLRFRLRFRRALGGAGLELGKPTQFTVLSKGAGRAALDVEVSGPGKGDAVRDLEVRDNRDGTHTVTYTPVQQVWPYTALYGPYMALHGPKSTPTPSPKIGRASCRERV